MARKKQDVAADAREAIAAVKPRARRGARPSADEAAAAGLPLIQREVVAYDDPVAEEAAASAPAVPAEPEASPDRVVGAPAPASVSAAARALAALNEAPAAAPEPAAATPPAPAPPPRSTAPAPSAPSAPLPPAPKPRGPRPAVDDLPTFPDRSLQVAVTIQASIGIVFGVVMVLVDVFLAQR